MKKIYIKPEIECIEFQISESLMNSTIGGPSGTWEGVEDGNIDDLG